MLIYKRYTAALLTVAAITLLTRCAPKAGKAVTTSDPATATASDKLADIKNHFTDQQVEEGKTIFNGNCSRCHKLRMPETRTIAQWEDILPRMSKKAALSESQFVLVRAYVLPRAKME